MPKSISDRPLVLGDLSRVWRFLKYALIPAVAVLMAALFKANDMNSKVDRIPVQDSILTALDKRTTRIEDKVNTIYDLLLSKNEHQD